MVAIAKPIKPEARMDGCYIFKAESPVEMQLMPLVKVKNKIREKIKKAKIDKLLKQETDSWFISVKILSMK